MNISIENFVTRRRIQPRELELARILRKYPEEERFQVIKEILNIHERVALEIAFRTLIRPKYFLDLLERGLAEANPQGIKKWLQYTVPKIGFRLTMKFLLRKLPEYPEGILRALYFLPTYLPQDNVQSNLYLQELRSALDRIKNEAK